MTDDKRRSSVPPYLGLSLLLRHARGELGDVDDDALVRAFADLLFLVAGFHAELHAPAIHRDHLRGERHAHADGRGGQVPHIDVGAHGIAAGIQQREQRVAAAALHVPDHDRVAFMERTRYPVFMGIRTVLSLVRVSGDAQVDRTGIPRQLEDIAAYCAKYSLAVADDGEYRFEGLSGALVEQSPKYREMLARISDTNISGIVFSSVDRFFRPEFLDQYSILKQFRVHHKLMFCDQGEIDQHNDQNMTLFKAAAEAAANHRKRIKEWTQRGKNIRRQEPNCTSDPLPQGVRFVPDGPKVYGRLDTGHFEYTHDFSSDRVVEAYNRIATGESQAVVSRELNFASPTKLRQTLRSHWWIGEKAILNTRVGRTMRDDGKMYDGKRVPRQKPIIKTANFTEPPLISRDLWNTVQAILDDRQKTWVQQKAKTNPQIEACLVHGLLCCECGMKMYPKKGLGAGKTTVMYYMCSSHTNGKTPCGRSMIHQTFVDAQLLWYVTWRLIDRDFLKRLAPVQPKSHTEAIQKRLERLEKKLEKQMRRIGEVDDELLLLRIIKDTETEITELKRQLRNQPKSVVFDVDLIRDRYLRFSKLSLAEQKSLLQSTFIKIPIANDGSIILDRIVWR